MAYLKAVAASLLAALTSLQASLDDGVSLQEWVTAGIAALVALGVVWGVPNKPVAEA